MEFAKFSNVKITLALFFVKEVGRRADYTNTDDLIIQRDKPPPMIFLLIEDQGVVFVGFTRSPIVANCVSNLRENSNLFVVGTEILRSGGAPKGRQPSCLSRTVEKHFRFDVLKLLAI